MAGKKVGSVTFQTMTDILRFAIEREEEAARSYAELAQKAGRSGLQTLLLELRAEEVHHKKLLQEVVAGKSAALPGRDVPDLKISDYLIEEPLDAGSRIQDLLIFAARKEAKAAAFYARLLSESSAAEHKSLFQFLVQEEKRHKLKLEQEYEKQVLQED